jgi:hypothetical protein
MTEFREEFIQEISLLNPNANVTDENINIPLEELQHNINFLAKLVSFASTTSPDFFSQLYGNLLDYNSAGQKIFSNGGNFDCFEKKNSWIAINDGLVANETDFQQEGASNLLVYKGGKSYTDVNGEHGKWIEREFFIPPLVRGTQFVFAIKGTGVYTLVDQVVPFDYEIPYCNDSLVPNVSAVGSPVCTTGSSATSSSPASGTCIPDLSTGCYARYEDIGVEVIGTGISIQDIKTLGPWPMFELYANDVENWKPKFRTTYVVFRAGRNTESVKIRIRRTRDDGALAMSQMFLGALPVPYEGYTFENIDINSFYNFNLGISKSNVTTVDGRFSASNCGQAKLSNLLTKEQLNCAIQYNKTVDEFDWDQLSGPRQSDLQFSSSVGPLSGYSPKTSVFEFDPGFDRFMHYNMRIDGPNPGLCYLGVSYFVNDNDFSGTLTCGVSGTDENRVCSNVKFDIKVAIVNTGDFGNPDELEFVTFSYLVPIPAYTFAGKMGYFEVYGDFYQKLLAGRGAIAYFSISRNGESVLDTFPGNFMIAGVKTGFAVPPDDEPNAGIYPNLFVGNTEC